MGAKRKPYIVPRDIGTYDVKSSSRPGYHRVDALELTCSCESYQKDKVGGKGSCVHLERLLRWIANSPQPKPKLQPKPARPIRL